MRHIAVLSVMLFAALGLQAQEDSIGSPKKGLQLLNASGYVVYYSRTLPGGGGFQPGGAGNLASDLGGGGSLQFGWSEAGERSSFSITYTPSFTGRLRYSSLNALNHAFSMNATRKVSHRWQFGLSAAGDYSTLDQFLFAPTAFGSAASVPVKFDDFAAGLLSG